MVSSESPSFQSLGTSNYSAVLNIFFWLCLSAFWKENKEMFAIVNAGQSMFLHQPLCCIGVFLVDLLSCT